jgi:hypothetical protein
VRVFVVGLSDRVSRHNAPGRPDALLAACRGRFSRGQSAVVLVPDARSGGAEIVPWVLALARGESTWTFKDKPAKKPAEPPRVAVAAVGPELGEVCNHLGTSMSALALNTLAGNGTPH